AGRPREAGTLAAVSWSRGVPRRAARDQATDAALEVGGDAKPPLAGVHLALVTARMLWAVTARSQTSWPSPTAPAYSRNAAAARTATRAPHGQGPRARAPRVSPASATHVA